MLLSEAYDNCLALGEDFYVTPKIKVRMPTVREIIKFGEKEYYRIVYAFASTSSDYKSQLDDEGLDWQEVSDYQLFQRLFMGMRKEDLSILFGDLDFKKFRLCKNNETGEFLFRNEEDDINIDRVVYDCISEYICAMHNLEKLSEKAGNETTRRAMIEEARDRLAMQRNKPYEPQLRAMAIAMSCTPEFKADFFGALDYPISIFMDSVQQVQQQKHFTFIMQGTYAGTVDLKKIPKAQLNWLKRPEAK